MAERWKQGRKESEGSGVTPKCEREDRVTPKCEREDGVTPECEREDTVTPECQCKNTVTSECEHENTVTPECEREDTVTLSLCVSQQNSISVMQGLHSMVQHFPLSSSALPPEF